MQKKAVVSNVCFFQTQPYLGKFLNLVGIQVELLQGSLKTEDLLGHLLKAAVGIVQHWDHLLLTTETTTRHQPANQLPLSGHFQTLNCERERKKREGIFESSLKVGICAVHIAFFLSWRFGLLHDKLIYTCVSKMMSDTLPRKSKKEKPWKNVPVCGCWNGSAHTTIHKTTLRSETSSSTEAPSTLWTLLQSSDFVICTYWAGICSGPLQSCGWWAITESKYPAVLKVCCFFIGAVQNCTPGQTVSSVSAVSS